MAFQKAFQFCFAPLFLTILLTAPQLKVQTESHKKQWIVFHKRIPEESRCYSIDLGYEPSSSSIYSDSRGDLQSVSLPDSEEIDGYEERLDFGTVLDGYNYSALLCDTRELKLLNDHGRQIHKVRILRTKDGAESKLVKEGYFFLGNQIQIPFEVRGQRLDLPTDDLLPGKLSMNIYSHQAYSYRGSYSSYVQGSLKGSTLIESADLEVSLSYRNSLRPKNMYIQLTLRPFDKELSTASASGKITEILKLRSAKLVVEKIARDRSELILAVLKGDISQAPDEKKHLMVNKPAPSFVGVAMFRRQLVTLEELCNKKGSSGYVVLIFGDLQRSRHHHGTELQMDETFITKMLQRDLDSRPAVVFVTRRFFLPDLYGRWLGRYPSFYVVGDTSNPMDIQFFISEDYGYRRSRSSGNSQSLREKFGLPQNKVSVVVVNGQGNVAYIEADAGQHLAESLAEINRLMKDKKSADR